MEYETDYDNSTLSSLTSCLRMLLYKKNLSSQHEQVIRLRNDLGLSFAEIGVALACSHNVARKLWLKAVKQLGQKLRCDESEYL